MRIGGTRVEAAQLQRRAEHVPDRIEHRRQRDRSAEDLPLVDEIRQTPRVLLGLELLAGAVPFCLEDLEDSLAQLAPQRLPHAPVEHRKAALVQLAPLLVGDHDRVAAKCFCATVRSRRAASIVRRVRSAGVAP